MPETILTPVTLWQSFDDTLPLKEAEDEVESLFADFGLFKILKIIAIEAAMIDKTKTPQIIHNAIKFFFFIFFLFSNFDYNCVFIS